MASATQYEGYGGNPYGNAEAGYAGFQEQQVSFVFQSDPLPWHLPTDTN